MTPPSHRRRTNRFSSLSLAMGLCIGSMLTYLCQSRVSHDSPRQPRPGAPATQWTCAMHPQVHDPQPGLCPVCAMDLVEAVGPKQTGFSPSATAQAQAGLKTSPIELGPLPPVQRRFFGQLRIDETQVRAVNSWVPGRVEQVLVDAPGIKVEAGQPLLVLHSPKLFAAEQHLVDAQLDPVSIAPGGHGYDHLRSARDSLRRMGFDAAALRRIEKSLRASPRLTVRAPQAGTVLDRLVEPGDHLAAGATMFRIANLERLELELEVHASQLAELAPGQAIEVTTTGYPGRRWKAEIKSLDAGIDLRTRRTYARATLDNADGILHPGMPVTVQLGLNPTATGERVPLIPSHAVLFTGRRSVVYVEESGPNGSHYIARSVTVGPRRGQVHQVLSGLSLGERVVTDGAFVLDAEAQLRGDSHMLELAQTSRSVPAVFKLEPADAKRLQPLFDTYLEIGRHLTKDEFLAAQRLAQPKAPPAAPEESPPELSAAWSSLFAAAHKANAQMSQATSLAELREAYQRMTRALLQFLTHVANPHAHSLYLAHCPMALEGGAHWLQAEAELSNVYFGPQMLRCGQIKLQLAPGQSLPMGAAELPSR